MKYSLGRSVDLKVEEDNDSHSFPKAMRNLLVEQLKDTYCAELTLLKAMPHFIKNATSEKLIEALTGLEDLNKEHVKRIEEALIAMEEKIESRKCEAMIGLIRDAEKIIHETESGTIRDEGIILGVQKIKHYEIATYGTLCAFARNEKEQDVAILLQKTLDQEYEADEIFTEIAEAINPENGFEEMKNQDLDDNTL
jgi:ferritin-like metal-binding protein YciE